MSLHIDTQNIVRGILREGLIRLLYNYTYTSAAALLTSPMRGRGYSTHSVCVCVCPLRCSGRYAYSTGPTKVPKESAHHKDQNKRRNRAKTS